MVEIMRHRPEKKAANGENKHPSVVSGETGLLYSKKRNVRYSIRGGLFFAEDWLL
jgi:hypothetical protein